MAKELELHVKHNGVFDRAFIDGERINREKLFQITGIKANSSLRLEHEVYEWSKNQSEYKLKLPIIERDTR